MSESPGEYERQVLAVLDQEVNAVRSGDINAYLDVLADDAKFLPPNENPKEGEELRQWLRTFLEEFSAEWLRFVHEEISLSGDLAYHRYSFSWKITPKVGGNPTVAHGKGLHIVRRRPGGAWKIVREIWNSSDQESSKDVR